MIPLLTFTVFTSPSFSMFLDPRIKRAQVFLNGDEQPRRVQADDGVPARREMAEGELLRLPPGNQGGKRVHGSDPFVDERRQQRQVPDGLGRDSSLNDIRQSFSVPESAVNFADDRVARIRMVGGVLEEHRVQNSSGGRVQLSAFENAL